MIYIQNWYFKELEKDDENASFSGEARKVENLN